METKNRLGELLETVLKSGAQTITRHGKPIAVVISAEAY
ncbi:MAG: type II toxin-antitoxin system prevent-host-death family antitoxin [Verrucomicrobia bacterium]|nr:type II toxin-antitoxin system prevent-host-death family antitoxin [Verrucomicrobiota bacterium]